MDKSYCQYCGGLLDSGNHCSNAWTNDHLSNKTTSDAFKIGDYKIPVISLPEYLPGAQSIEFSFVLTDEEMESLKKLFQDALSVDHGPIQWRPENEQKANL